MKRNFLFYSSVVAFGLAGCSSYEDSNSFEYENVVVRTEETSGATRDKTDERTTIDLKDRAMVCSLNPNSPLSSRLDVFCKAIVAIEDAVVYQDPATGAKNDIKVPLFQILYVFSKERHNGQTFVLVGKSFNKGSKIGYINESDLVYWNHRVGVCPQYASSRSNHIRIYATAEDAQASLEGKDVEPSATFDVSPSRPRPVQPWLITDKIPLRDGKIAYKVCAPGRKESVNSDGGNLYSNEEIKDMAIAVRRLDVAFLIDSTASMRKAIEDVREGVVQVAQAIEQSKTEENVDVSFALVVYRDVIDGDNQFEFYNLNDLNAFVERISRLKAFGGGDGPERGAPAAKEAIVKLDWRPGSIRHLIAVGDASWHESGPNNPDSIGNDYLAELAERNRVHISVLAVDRKNLMNQLDSLVKKTDGEALLFDAENDSLANDLATKLKKHLANSELGGDVFDSFASGADAKTAARNLGESIEKIYDVVNVLRTQGVDFERFKSRLDAGQTTLIDGWIVADENSDSETLELEIFLRRFEADYLKALYESYRQSDEGSILDKYRDCMILAVGSRLQDPNAPNVYRTDFSNSGLPFNSQSILRLSEDDFRAMNQVQRAKLFHNLDEKIQTFDSYLNNDGRWSKFTETPSGWIPEKAFF